MYQLRKICQHHLKERLNIRNLAKFESDMSYKSELRHSSAKLRKFTDVCIVKGKFVSPTIQMSHVKLRDFGELYHCQFSTTHFQT